MIYAGLPDELDKFNDLRFCIFGSVGRIADKALSSIALSEGNRVTRSDNIIYKLDRSRA